MESALQQRNEHWLYVSTGLRLEISLALKDNTKIEPITVNKAVRRLLTNRHGKDVSITGVREQDDATFRKVWVGSCAIGKRTYQFAVSKPTLIESVNGERRWGIKRA